MKRPLIAVHTLYLVESTKIFGQQQDPEHSQRRIPCLDRPFRRYLEAFQFDWRDAYPGVNAVTLMGLQERPDSRQGGLLPVLRYAAVQSAEDAPEYWDYATLLELAVLSDDHEDAGKRLAEALGSARAKWELDSTTRNLGLIRGAKQARGEPVEWIMEIEKALNGATLAR